MPPIAHGRRSAWRGAAASRAPRSSHRPVTLSTLPGAASLSAAVSASAVGRKRPLTCECTSEDELKRRQPFVAAYLVGDRSGVRRWPRTASPSSARKKRPPQAGSAPCLGVGVGVGVRLGLGLGLGVAHLACNPLRVLALLHLVSLVRVRVRVRVRGQLATHACAWATMGIGHARAHDVRRRWGAHAPRTV
eukprot:scaffold4738_cov45-Phaeocystis_antarctica.AAC.2